MKPFNLEKALNGHPVVTKDGREVVDLHYFKESTSIYKLHGVVKGKHEQGVKSWTNDGIYNQGAKKESDLDIFLKTEQRTVYVNIMKSFDGALYTFVHDTPEAADIAAYMTDFLVVAHPITFEE